MGMSSLQWPGQWVNNMSTIPFILFLWMIYTCTSKCKRVTSSLTNWCSGWDFKYVKCDTKQPKDLKYIFHLSPIQTHEESKGESQLIEIRYHSCQWRSMQNQCHCLGLPT